MAFNLASFSQAPAIDWSKPYYPEAQLGTGGFGFQLRNQQAKQFIDDLNAKVASGQITQEQANQAWAKVHEAGNEADRARETSGRRFDQGGYALVGSMGLGGVLGGITGGEADAAGAASGGGDAGGVSPTLDATQDPLGSGGDPGNPAASSGSSGRGAAGTALSRIMDGTASTADWLAVGGNLASTGLGIAGSRNAANAFRDLNDRYMAFGAPSRGRYEASMTPGFDPNSIPGYAGAVDTASKGILARLAATGGNPWGNPGGLIEANKQIISGTALPAIQAYQNQNAATGGYGAFNTAAPAAATAGIGAQGGVYNAVGSGLAGLLNPQPSLYDTLRALNVQGLS